VVLAKFDRFAEEVRQRKLIGQRYNQLLENKVRTVTLRPDRTSVFAQYTVMVDNREIVQQHFQSVGIPTAVHYPFPLHKQPAYAHLVHNKELPISEMIAHQCLSLPMHPYLSENDQRTLSENLITALMN
jgi:UDP-2-acetamido-2-deoxy-ribo-hexuluronate aminotransferase